MGAPQDVDDSSLLDVTGLSLTALAQLDSTAIDRVFERMLPPRGAVGQCNGDAVSSRLWQNYAEQLKY